MSFNMAILESSPSRLAIGEPDNCVRSDFREDQYFRLQVVGVQEQESTPGELSLSNAGSALAPIRSQGQSANGRSHEVSGKFASKTYDTCGTATSLAQMQLAGHSIAELERETIQQTLQMNGGNRKRSAEILGISVRTLQRKLKEWRHATR